MAQSISALQQRALSETSLNPLATPKPAALNRQISGAFILKPKT